jgi:hypothetical protein
MHIKKEAKMVCEKHKSYKAVKPPTAKCIPCRKVYVFVNHDKYTAEELAQKLNKTVTTVKNYLTQMGLEEKEQATATTKKPSVSETVSYEQKIEKLKGELGEVKKKLKKAYKENSLTEEVVEFAKETIQAIPFINPKTRPVKDDSKTSETVVSLLSCLHVGEVVKEEEMGGLGKYNFEVFLERAQLYEDSLVDILANKMRGYHFPRLVILGLGDFVTGEIHAELERTNEFEVIEQAKRVSMVIAQVMVNIHRRLGIPIHFSGVVGNHGRKRKQKEFKGRDESFDRLAYEMMSLFTANHKEITYDIPKSFFHIIEIEGKKFLFLHGDNVKGWMGIPFYGLKRMADNFQAILAGHGRSYDYVCMAHFHQNMSMDAVRGEYFMNGTWKGGDEYALGALFVVADPRQQLFSVNPRKGITWRLPLSLRFTKPYDGRYGYTWEVADKLNSFE